MLIIFRTNENKVVDIFLDERATLRLRQEVVICDYKKPFRICCEKTPNWNGLRMNELIKRITNVPYYPRCSEKIINGPYKVDPTRYKWTYGAPINGGK